MNGWADIFSHLCGQGRCFVIDGEVLPVCQRCLGLYLGAALTAAWIVVGRLWRRGLPPTTIVVANAAALAAAMLGGLHAIDAGPRWRLACGLWTGHVALLWLTSAGAHLWRAGRANVRADDPWRRGDRLAALAALPALACLAIGFDRLTFLGRDFWSTAAALGAACLAGGLVLAAAGVARWLVRSGRRGRPAGRERRPERAKRSGKGRLPAPISGSPLGLPVQAG
jgi:hypothetical protein